MRTWIFIPSQLCGKASRLSLNVGLATMVSNSAPVKRSQDLRFVLVPDASQYPPTSWLREPPDWLRKDELDPNRFILAVVA